MHKQPYGLVHGGLNGVLIETACSLGANENVPENTFAVGIDLQVNHLRSVHDGSLTRLRRPITRERPFKFGKQKFITQTTN